MATAVSPGVANDPASVDSSCQMAARRVASGASVKVRRATGGNIPRRHAHIDKVKAGTPKAVWAASAPMPATVARCWLRSGVQRARSPTVRSSRQPGSNPRLMEGRPAIPHIMARVKHFPWNSLVAKPACPTRRARNSLANVTRPSPKARASAGLPGQTSLLPAAAASMASVRAAAREVSATRAYSCCPRPKRTTAPAAPAVRPGALPLCRLRTPRAQTP